LKECLAHIKNKPERMPHVPTANTPKIHFSVLKLARAAVTSPEIESSFLFAVSAWPSRYVTVLSIPATFIERSKNRSVAAGLPPGTATSSAEVACSALDCRGRTKVCSCLSSNPFPRRRRGATKIAFRPYNDSEAYWTTDAQANSLRKLLGCSRARCNHKP